MNRWKSSLSCSYCSKVLKDLCKNLLVEKSENKIKCVECKSEFKIKENDFKLKKLVKKQLDENLYFKKANRRLNSNILSDVRRIHFE
jgi:hypothetical protein